uniref:N-acetyltransferase n=1 Tax=Rhizophora mucronata TaxID=61149 RepID=A0A2P2J4J6_RHIMU
MLLRLLDFIEGKKKRRRKSWQGLWRFVLIRWVLMLRLPRLLLQRILLTFATWLLSSRFVGGVLGGIF